MTETILSSSLPPLFYFVFDKRQQESFLCVWQHRQTNTINVDSEGLVLSYLTNPWHSFNTYNAPQKLCHFVKCKQKQISVICKHTCFPGYKMIDLFCPCLRIPILLPDTHESAYLCNGLFVLHFFFSLFLPFSVIVLQINQKYFLTFLSAVRPRINCFCCIFNWILYQRICAFDISNGGSNRGECHAKCFFLSLCSLNAWSTEPISIITVFVLTQTKFTVPVVLICSILLSHSHRLSWFHHLLEIRPVRLISNSATKDIYVVCSRLVCSPCYTVWVLDWAKIKARSLWASQSLPCHNNQNVIMNNVWKRLWLFLSTNLHNELQTKQSVCIY